MLTELTCKRCGYKWEPRKRDDLPKCCPACKSRYWDLDEAPRIGAKKKYVEVKD